MKKEKHKIGFRYNPLNPILKEQTNKQGFTFDFNTNIILERMRGDIFILKFTKNISDKDHKSLLKAFHNIVIKCLKEIR